MSSLSTIITLPDEVINQIAAGEVVERPASVVKELMENALDAGADRIEIFIENGGIGSIIIQDNGHGMSKGDLALALKRHATSKLKARENGQWDLMNIASMGFRGEALPSIASTARLSLTSRAQGTEESWMIYVEGGKQSEIKPVARLKHSGTRVEVKDLFYAVPARLKFLKTPRTEFQAISDCVKRIAMAHPSIGIQLFHDQKEVLSLPAQEEGKQGSLIRLSAILGQAFQQNALPVYAEREGMKLTGFAGLPTFHRGARTHQYLYVNGRSVKDKLFSASIRAAYQDLLARDRHPVLVLFLTLPLAFVDVNAHPAKTEIRFRNPALVRGFLIGTLKAVLAEAGHRTSPTLSQYALGRAQISGKPSASIKASFRNSSYQRTAAPGPEQQRLIDGFSAQGISPSVIQKADTHTLRKTEEGAVSETSQTGFEHADTVPQKRMDSVSFPEPDPDLPLGLARAQMHENYILAQTMDGIVIVDQHAAHERLVYEGMKRELETGGIKRQSLLIPEIIELDADEVKRILDVGASLEELGLLIEPFGKTAIAVRETPALLGQTDIQKLVKDLVDDLSNYGETFSLKECLHEVCATMACYGSVRSGRRLNFEEMNALLRQMEKTSYSGQCNHGRPTYVELKLSDIESLFGRR